jgi:hypothetical protein
LVYTNWLNGHELRFGSDPCYQVGSGSRSGFLRACRASAGPAAGPHIEDERGRPAGLVQVLTGFQPRVLREK